MTVRLRVRRRANWAAPRMGYKGWMDLQSGGCSAAPKMRGRRIALGRIGDRPRNGAGTRVVLLVLAIVRAVKSLGALGQCPQGVFGRALTSMTPSGAWQRQPCNGNWAETVPTEIGAGRN